MRISPGLLVVLVGLASPLTAQRVGVSAHGGSLGAGVDVLVMANSRLAFRASGNYMPFNVSFHFSGNRFEVDLPGFRWGLVADLFLLGDFRITAGAVTARAMDMTADLPSGVLVIGGTPYPSDLVGALSGRIETHTVVPYFGFGVGAPGRKVTLFLDLGVGLQGNPQVTLEASGPLASTTTFQGDLENERRDVERDAEVFRYYPVVSIGLMVGVW